MRLHPEDIRAIARAVRAELAGALSLREPLGAADAPDAPEWMSPKELGSIIRITIVVLRTWRKEGKGPRWHRFGNRVYYSRPDVKAWIASQEAMPDPRGPELAARARAHKRSGAPG